MLKRLAERIVKYMREENERLNAPAPDVVRPATNMDRMFGDCAPAIVAFKIENGYVVRSVRVDPYEHGVASGFTYCKDHQAIADHIVSEAAREKVMPKQASLAYGSPHAQQVSSNKITVR